ncbi:hypothetical protein QE431_002203 [Flavobacterium sp. SORGH_AS 622]|nr:hypothetical protein [Flavobacterium sp. SORGH_AS_0622]
MKSEDEKKFKDILIEIMTAIIIEWIRIKFFN